MEVIFSHNITIFRIISWIIRNLPTGRNLLYEQFSWKLKAEFFFCLPSELITKQVGKTRVETWDQLPTYFTKYLGFFFLSERTQI